MRQYDAATPSMASLSTMCKLPWSPWRLSFKLSIHRWPSA